MATYEYHNRLRQLVEDPCWNGRFQPPSKGPREYRLDNRCAADFCYDLSPSGKLFIEDDDPPRALSNLIKYWPWCCARPLAEAAYLIHIIADRGESVHLKQCDFLAEKMREDLGRMRFRFRYYQIKIGGAQDWHEPDTWLPRVRKVLEDIMHEEAPPE